MEAIHTQRQELAVTLMRLDGCLSRLAEAKSPKKAACEARSELLTIRKQVNTLRDGLLNLYKPTAEKSALVDGENVDGMPCNTKGVPSLSDCKMEGVEAIISTPLTIFDEGKGPHDSPPVVESVAESVAEPVVESPPVIETPQPLVASKRRSRVSK